VQGLQQLGWDQGRNVRSDYRWGADDADRFLRRRHRASGTSRDGQPKPLSEVTNHFGEKLEK
jgi:hypothetical protein